MNIGVTDGGCQKIYDGDFEVRRSVGVNVFPAGTLPKYYVWNR